MGGGLPGSPVLVDRLFLCLVFYLLHSVFPLHDVVDYRVWRNETTAHNLFRQINYGDIRVLCVFSVV